jgi:hypothetical protein
MDAEVHIGGRDVELCRRRAVEHAHAEEDGDEDDFVVFALICGEGVSDWARLLLGCRLGCLRGPFAGLPWWAVAAR